MGKHIPAFRLIVDGDDKTDSLGEHLVGLTLTDNKGFEADTLVITLEDSQGTLEIPPTGVVIKLALGYEGALEDKGTYTVDEVGHSGPPDQLIIVARSADFREGFKAQRTYAWHDITLGDIINTLASYYGLIPAVGNDIKAQPIKHIDQTAESDANFLARLGKTYDAIATVKNGHLLFIRAGQGKTASGQALDTATIKRSDGDQHNYSASDKTGKYSGVQGRWLSTDDAQVHYELAGENGTLKTIKKTYATQAEAKAAAYAEWQRINRQAAGLSLSLAGGRLDLMPDQPITVEGYKPQLDSMRWIVNTLTHTLSASSGLSTGVNLETAPGT